ncbi:MAG: exodeoxyribonuclease VII large subunit [Paludibacteraceae bacterium]|nr:exodeoxyribonuclease VII large subunit [Paludibacteraceae bacterium]
MNSLSLSELSQYIGDVLSAELDPTYWVRAEIAGLSVRGGHAYWELVEKAETGLFAAKVRATCWSNMYPMLSAYFESETGTALQVGMQVLLEAEVSYHPVYGLSLNIVNIDPSYTLGDLAQQRQQTIARLQKEGVFDMQKQLAFPTLIRRLAVVSSTSAAGYEDFMHQLSPLHCAITTFSATMQGANAAADLVQQLQTIAQRSEEFDAVVIIRGGGAGTDLTCFDDYNLCNHIAQFPLPILTGIGHTRDISIADMVAAVALKTPTAVADWLLDRVQVQREYIDRLRLRLRQTAERQVLIRRHHIELLRQTLAMQSPERIYQKGYSLLTIRGQVVRSVNDVHSGDILTSHLADGTISSQAQ